MVHDESSVKLFNGTDGQTEGALGFDNSEISTNSTVQMFMGNNFGISGEVLGGQAPIQEKVDRLESFEDKNGLS